MCTLRIGKSRNSSGCRKGRSSLHSNKKKGGHKDSLPVFSCNTRDNEQKNSALLLTRKPAATLPFKNNRYSKNKNKPSRRTYMLYTFKIRRKQQHRQQKKTKAGKQASKNIYIYIFMHTTQHNTTLHTLSQQNTAKHTISQQ